MKKIFFILGLFSGATSSAFDRQGCGTALERLRQSEERQAYAAAMLGADFNASTSHFNSVIRHCGLDIDPEQPFSERQEACLDAVGIDGADEDSLIHLAHRTGEKKWRAEQALDLQAKARAAVDAALEICTKE